MSKLVGAIMLALFLVAPAVAQSPYVKLQTGPSGWGSAFHVGDGIYMTAAHVVEGLAEVEVVPEAGLPRAGTVLAASEQHDVAIVAAAAIPLSADIACKEPTVGIAVVVYGGAIGFERLEFRGYVAGTSRAVSQAWPVAVPLDATLLPGISGGAVVDEAGKVVGMALGLSAVETTPPLVSSATGLGWAAPGSVLCDFLASWRKTSGRGR